MMVGLDELPRHQQPASSQAPEDDDDDDAADAVAGCDFSTRPEHPGTILA
jgi:hypothetical protein